MQTLLLTLSFFALVLLSRGQAADITLKVTEIKEVKGNMSIALFKSSDGFPSGDQFIIGKNIPVNAKEFTYVIKDVPPGIYAIAIYHDLDKNGELNNNWLGIPKEPYGFSNDANGKMGPPDYEDATFEVKKDMEIIITLID